MLTYGIPPDIRSGVHLFFLLSYAIGLVPRLSGHALGTDGGHCRESAGTGPVDLKAVPLTGAELAGHHGPINMRLSFPHPLLV